MFFIIEVELQTALKMKILTSYSQDMNSQFRVQFTIINDTLKYCWQHRILRIF